MRLRVLLCGLAKARLRTPGDRWLGPGGQHQSPRAECSGDTEARAGIDAGEIPVGRDGRGSLGKPWGLSGRVALSLSALPQFSEFL